MQISEDPSTRRSTRNALSEIPSPLGRRSLNNNVQNTFLANTINFLEGNSVPTTFLSPSPSPDEMIIRQRGRRRIPVAFSPDIDELKRNRDNSQKDRTPVKQPPSPGPSSSIVLRSTPRKRLLLSDPSEINSNDNSPKSSPKKSKSDSTNECEDEICDTLKAYTSNQLITIIKKLLTKRPELEKDLKEVIPEPDLRPLEQHLMYLKRNICKALPVNRLCSKTDAIAYHRAASHLIAFKKAIFDQGRRLSESKQWPAVIEYVTMAWKLVRMIPTFDNASHNLPRKQCFRFLATQCISSLKTGQFTHEQLQFYYSKLRNFVADSDEIKQCLNHLENVKSSV